MTRDEVVAECTRMVAACWNHYSDTELSEYRQQIIEDVLFDSLPEDFQNEEDNECDATEADIY